jgi:dienelactone hydrolase
MLESSHSVRIERHTLPPNIVALTFQREPQVEGEVPPLVFALHGLGSRKERHLDLCLRLAEAGFLACMLDASCHGERQTENCAPLSGDRTSEAFTIAFQASVHQTVQDVMSIATELGRDSYGVIGHSMGGHTAMLLAAEDRRAAAVVNVSGSLYMNEKFAIDRKFAPTTVHSLRESDPATKAERYAPRPILLLHGEDDMTVPISGAYRLYNALSAAYPTDDDRCRFVAMPGKGHAWIPEMAEQSVAWMQIYLLEATKGTT